MYLVDLHGQVGSRLGGLEAEVTSLHFDGTHVAAAGVNGEVWVWAVRSQRSLRRTFPQTMGDHVFCPHAFLACLHFVVSDSHKSSKPC